MLTSVCSSSPLSMAPLSLHGGKGALAKIETPLDLATQERGSGSCTKYTPLNNVRVNQSQAGEVSSHFNFAPTSVLGPAKSRLQPWSLTDAASVGDRKAIGNSGPQTGTTAGVGHLGSSAILVGLGGIYVILQAAWKLCGLCINDRMQIVPSGHSLFSPNFTAWHTQGQAGGSVLTV